MLQIDHVYEFFYENIFNDFSVCHLPGGVPKISNPTWNDIYLFTTSLNNSKIFFYDQEPFIPSIADQYFSLFNHNENVIVCVSEHSEEVDQYKKLYYFFHGFAALDWYRGHYALNYNKSMAKTYKHDYITYNRIINMDRSYRIYFVSLLKEKGLIDQGLVSFGVTDNITSNWQDEVVDPKTKLSHQAQQHIKRNLINTNMLIIDSDSIPGSASANIPRTINSWMFNNEAPNLDAFWHVVTETVFYYDKLHLTEKIFKPIVSKQPFMLLAAPGNLAYLKNYGFKTFDGIIDESYDKIIDNDTRIEAVVNQLAWYCNLSDIEKTNIVRAVEPIVLHNFHHFYGEFKHIISQELITNTKTLFKNIDYNDKHIDYSAIFHILTH